MVDFFAHLAGIVSLGIFLVLVAVASRGIERTKGRNVMYHGIYVVFPIIGFFLPMGIKEVLFTGLSVAVAGSVIPIYESIRAVCTVEQEDDTIWLTYWVVQGIVSFSTQWVDGFGNGISLHWYIFEFFFYLWLLLPWTDGATLIFDFIVEPIVGPIVQPIVQKMDNVISKIIALVVNAAHLSIVWVAFVFLNPALKRAIWILIATVFPIGSSIVSITTPGSTDDTYWLTYWSCFNILFLLTDVIDDFVGKIPGFYTIIIGLTIYLMLPLFRGSDKVFRTILVPLAGLQELLVRRDAEEIKRTALQEIAPERRALVLKEIAESYATDARKLESENKTGYQSIGDSQIV